MRFLRRRSALSTLVAIGLISCIDGPTTPLPAVIGTRAALDVVPPAIVISQVYGGGGNASANWRNDYVELFNPGQSAVDVSGWKLQYTSAGGNSWSSNSATLPASTTIAPGKYFLIGLSPNGTSTVGALLPATDFSNTSINMSGTSGKVILTNGVTGSGNCPKGGGIIDFVGYGTSTNCTGSADWGSSATGNLTTTTAATRKGNGCTYTGVLSADFSALTAAPRNSATTAAPCAPIVAGPLDHLVITGTTGVTVGSQTALTVALKDASNLTITDPSATYTAVSADETTAHVVSVVGNVVTLQGQQPSNPTVDVTISATSNSITKQLVVPVTVNEAATITPSTTFVSEIHYDNNGTDAGEAMEIEGDAGTSLDGWSLVMYNGSAGSQTLGVYATVPLSGTIPATCGARGVVTVPFAVNGIQNGDADGWALINAQGQITELTSYEGTFTPTTGPAAGLTSTDIGVAEGNSTLATQSLQRAENGVWFGPNANTFGACNPATPLVPEGSVTITSGKTSLAFAMQTQFFFGGVNLSGNPVTSVVWSTSDTTIIKVDQKGIVTAKGVGSAKLIATAPDNAFGSITMSVYLAAGSTSIRVGHNTEFGEPADADASDDKIIRRAQYTVSYNPNRGGANWVSWNLDASHIGDNGRCPGTCYSADTALANFVPPILAHTTADWVSGNTYDRGHMAPSADWTSSEADNNTTFFLTNFLPQTHALNAGPWEALENALRDSVSVANGSREAYIIAGGIFTNGVGLGTMGAGIAIPDSTWKIAVITPANTGLNPDGTLPAHTTVLVVNMPNVATLDNDWTVYSHTSIAKIEKSTGYNFLALITESVQCQIEQRNCPPTARVTSDVVGGHAIVGQHINFSGATSTDPDEGDALSFAWTIDGSPAGTGATINHEFLTTGTHQVHLTATDLGGLSNSTDASVIVDPRPTPNCGAGRFENAADDFACDPAPPGAYVPDDHATAAIPCAAGYYQPNSGQTSCLAAPAGSYVGSTGAIAATPCGLGTFQNATASTSCISSPPGNYVSTIGATAATACPAGSYQPSSGETSCISAPAGSYVASPGSALATQCSYGFYQPNTGATSCIAAPVGSYVDVIGATSSTPCPIGMTTNSTGTTSAAGCVWLPPAQLTQLVTDALNALLSSGALGSGDANPIQVSIDQAQASIARGNLTAARNQLGAARNKVQAAVNAGRLTAAAAADLLAAIDRAVAHM